PGHREPKMEIPVQDSLAPDKNNEKRRSGGGRRMYNRWWRGSHTGKRRRKIMKKTPVPQTGSKVLNKAQAKIVGSHFRKIALEVGRMQKYLEEIGVRPVGGWKDPYDYSLV